MRTQTCVSMLLVPGIAVWLAASAAASTLHVPSAFPTIQAAINAAQPGDIVLVAPGVYTGAGNVDLSFGGKAITVRSSTGPNECIIDCNGSTAAPRRGFAFQSGETPAAEVDGFTIRRGATANGAVADPFNGAAILCNNLSSPTIRNCILENNVAACWGGAVCCTSASPTLINCIIRNNTVGDDGGALFAWQNSSPTLINCVLAGNTSGVTGGAITNFSGATPIRVRNCTIVGNSAFHGSATYGWYLDIRNSIVWNNTGSAFQIYNHSNVVVQHSNVQGGHAGEGNVDLEPGFKDISQGDFQLSANSPMIDRGSNAAVPDGIAVDLEGAARFLDDPGTSDTGFGDGAIVDLGALEFTGNSCPGDTNGDRAITLTDLATLLSLFGTSGESPAADVDRDWDVDLTDLATLLSAFGSTCE